MAYSFGAPKIVTNGLVLYLDAANRRSYPGSGTTWNDLSGNGNNGTLTNGPTFNGDNAGSIVFDGVNDYSTNTSANGITFGNNDHALCVFFKLTDINTNYNYLVAIGQPTTGDQSSVGVFDDFTLFTSAYSSPIVNTTATPITLNKWTHLVASYNGATDTMSYYVDGAFVESKVIALDVTGTRITINANVGNNSHSHVNISQIQIYNRALSAEEVLQNYNATKARYNL